MEYIKYIEKKLVSPSSDSLVERAVKFLGDNYPEKSSYIEYAIVDKWIDRIIKKWNVEFREIHSKQENLLGKLEAKRGGFIVNLNSSLISTQKRLVIAHELAHILSYEDITNIPKYPLIHSWEEETFCDQIARAILIPETLLNIPSINISNYNEEIYSTLMHLKSNFKISVWQIILRLLDEANNDGIISIFWKFFETENCLKIVDYNKNKGKVFIPLGDRIILDDKSKKVEANFLPLNAFNEKKLYQEFDLITIGSIYKKRYFSICFPVKNYVDDFVIQIINTKSGDVK